jgi:hypothetical protein
MHGRVQIGLIVQDWINRRLFCKKQCMAGYRLVLFFRIGSTAGSFAQSNEALASIKYVGLLDHFSKFYFLEKSSLWSSMMHSKE